MHSNKEEYEKLLKKKIKYEKKCMVGTGENLNSNIRDKKKKYYEYKLNSIKYEQKGGNAFSSPEGKKVEEKLNEIRNLLGPLSTKIKYTDDESIKNDVEMFVLKYTLIKLMYKEDEYEEHIDKLKEEYKQYCENVTNTNAIHDALVRHVDFNNEITI